MKAAITFLIIMKEVVVIVNNQRKNLLKIIMIDGNRQIFISKIQTMIFLLKSLKNLIKKM